MFRIIAFLIALIFIPEYSQCNTINKIDTFREANNIKIVIQLDKPVKEFSVKKEANKILISISKTDIKPEAISNIDKNIKKIDFTSDLKNTYITIEFNKNLETMLYDKEDNRIIITVSTEKNVSSKKDLAKENVFPYELPEVPQKIETPFEKKIYSGEKISLDLQDADLRSVLRMLSEIGNVNIVLGEEIEGKITLKLKDTPWDQVLDIIMARFGLGKAKINNIIYIAPLQKLQKQAEELRKLKKALAESKEEGPTKTEYITVNYINACDMLSEETSKQTNKDKNAPKEKKKAISIKDLLSKNGVATCDERTNTLIIKDNKENIEEIKKLISFLDKPIKQVLIEARIVEASSNFAKNLGIQWYGGYYKVNNKTNYKISPSTSFPVRTNGRVNENGGIIDSQSGTYWPNPSDTPWEAALPFGPIVDLGVPFTSKLGFAIGHITKTSALLLDLQLSAMEEQGQGKIVSSPRIITRDNGEAVIRQGYKIPYLELTDQGTATTKFIDADLTLKVVPHILPNNEIRLEINIDKSEPDWAKQVNGVPAILTRSAQTFVRIPNNGTVVIGGLKISKKQEAYGRVPGLSKIPAVGNLFKNSQKSEEEQELLIFITSKVISSAVEEIDY